MTWVIEKTGPGEKENRVEFGAFRGAGLVLVTVGGVREWDSKPDATRALEVYREHLRYEAAVRAGQMDLFGGGPR